MPLLCSKKHSLKRINLLFSSLIFGNKQWMLKNFFSKICLTIIWEVIVAEKRFQSFFDKLQLV